MSFRVQLKGQFKAGFSIIDHLLRLRRVGVGRIGCLNPAEHNKKGPLT